MSINTSVEIVDSVFLLLYDKIVQRCTPFKLNRGKGAAHFGYDGYENMTGSITYIMMKKSPIVRDYLESAKEIEGNRLGRNTKQIKVNGKHLYNKKLDAQKGKTVSLKGVYAKIYFIFLGFDNFEEFLEAYKDEIDPGKLDVQLDLQGSKNKFVSLSAPTFVCYYYSYIENRIKKFIMRIDPVKNFNVVQKGFHFSKEIDSTDNRNSIFIDDSKVYEGTAREIKSCLAIDLKTGKLATEESYMSIFLYKGEMKIEDMTLVRGSMNTMSTHGYIFMSEIFLKRISNDTSDERALSIAFDQEVTEYNFIKRYLFLQRRTFRIPPITEQNIIKVFARKHDLFVLESMVGIWKIWGLDYKNRVWQSKLTIQNDYFSELETYSSNRNEKQVCVLNTAQGKNGVNLWISAHEEHKIDMKNIALINISGNFSKKSNVTSGVSCGLGVARSVFAITPIVLIRISPSNAWVQDDEDKKDIQDDSDFYIGKLNKVLLRNLFLGPSKKQSHIDAYQILEKFASERNRKNQKFISYSEIINVADK